MNGQLLKVREIIHTQRREIIKNSMMGMGSGGENTLFAKVWCQFENRPRDISVVTVKPVNCRQTQTSETLMEFKSLICMF
jgi:ribosomal protein L27